MPSVGKTFVFPRQDNIYEHKESIPYDEAQCKVWVDRPRQRQKEHIREWTAYMLLGLCIGITAFIMVTIEEFLSENIADITQDLISKGRSSIENNVTPWLFFAGMSSICAIISGLMTTYYGPGASGSGVAEYIGYCNGVNYPDFISISTLITKVFGVTLAVVGRLCIGKEGPLAHIGAVWGVLVLYLPFGPDFKFLQNDEKRRCFTAAGCSAGVSVAFGAPIGGTLFSYEMSRPNTFWRFSVIWKVFASCSIATFTLALLSNIK